MVMQAKPVDKTFAARYAEKLLKKQVVDATPQHFSECYLFVGADDKGFALVSADDCVRPLLAYSYDGTFDPDRMPAHVAAWVDGYRREIASVVAAGITPSPSVQAMWENLSTGKSSNAVEPLLTTRWAQRPYYNSLCPYDTIDSTYAVTGCVATAMAQIMRYWEYPATGWGSHSYTHPRYGTLTADFGFTHYRWDRMPDTLDALSDSFQVASVATLMYHAGVAVNMNYSTQGSGSAVISLHGITYSCAENALKTYFRYNPLLYGNYKASYGDAEWDAMLRAELDAARPVLYSGNDINAGGHAFVLDGYDTLGFFHVNWGWGGRYDAYYTVDSLSPGAGSLGGTALYTFNGRNSAIFEVYPIAAPTDTVVTVDIAVNEPTWGYVEGNGTYHLYDTVTVIPHAIEGFRYQRMASGRKKIPISFLAVNDVTDSVIFERIEGDTVGYCNDEPISFWRDDYGNTTEWGIRIPPVIRTARQLTAVQFYYRVAGDYILNIYQGDSINGATPVYTGFYSLGGGEGWRTLTLDSALTFHYTQPVWITFSFTDTLHSYSLACGSYCGNSDGCWYHLPDGWMPYDGQGVYYSWMVRAVFDSREQFHVAAAPSDLFAGDVVGMGFYSPGDTVTLNAIPHNGYMFSYWSNGSTENPLRFVLTCDTTFIAFFESITGIEEIDILGMVNYEVNGRRLTVYNTTGKALGLYDVQGRQLVTSYLSPFTYLLPAPGVYLLKIAGLPARKIVVLN